MKNDFRDLFRYNRKSMWKICLLAGIVILLAAGSFFLFRSSETVTVICMGDSITYGSGVKETRERDSYPAQLKALLGKRYQVFNYGVGGKTLLDTADKPYRDTGYLEKVVHGKPNMIVLMLGTNDSRPNNWNRDEFRRQYVALVQELQKIASSPKICIMVPPKAFPNEEGRVIYQIDDDVIREQIAGIVKKTAEDTGVSCINLYELTEKHPEYFADGVHPNREGNQVIAREVSRWIKESD